MKRLLSLFLAACLALPLSGCLADYDTPKHAELSEQYDFYADSQSALSSGMAITPVSYTHLTLPTNSRV